MRVGKRNIFLAWLALTCLTLVSVFGGIHDHHDANGWTEPHSCTACQWHLNAKTDVPVCEAVPVVRFAVVRQLVLIPTSVLPIPPYFPVTASRAPPVDPA